ncbi:hypothetical protein [Streptomyces sp. NPDC021969]|uniref:hypothetical protein n=1 Tax=unclassified Streptomyces TaxID=2593676 RepID=UPI00340335C8
MARERDGWEWVDGAPRWAPTVEIAMAEITTGLYGDEYEETRRQLEALVRAAQRDAAEELRHLADQEDVLAETYGATKYVEGLSYASKHIFPDYPEESDSE